MRIKTNGYVAIGDGNYTPSQKLDVQGNVASNHVVLNSDIRYKKNIKDLEKSKVSKLYQLSAKSYNLNTWISADIKDGDATASDSSSVVIPDTSDNKMNIGLIAQDVQVLFPELVYTRDNGYLMLDYISLIPILIEALKEQRSTLDDLQKQIDKTSLKSADTDMIIDSKDPGVAEAAIEQNQPNPFNENTTIAYFLPSDIQNATFYIYDMNGKQLKSIGIAERENGSIMIYANELNPGMYYYSLIADGQIIGTKQMILTD
jgi:hypothetical protein